MTDGCYAFTRHEHLAPPIVSTVVGADPCASVTTVSVRFGEAIVMAQDRPTIANRQWPRRNATFRPGHAGY